MAPRAHQHGGQYIYATSLSSGVLTSGPSLHSSLRMATVAPQDQDPITYAQSLSSHSEKEKCAFTADIASVSGGSEGIEPHVRSINTDDPFPESPDAPVEEQQLTVRAVLVGCILGGIIAASNIYTHPFTQTGWTFGASLFGSIIGFAILKPLSRSAPTFLGGGYFGPRVFLPHTNLGY